MTGRFPGSLAFGCLVIGLGNLAAIHQVPKSDVASRRTQNFLLFISSNNVNRQNVFQINCIFREGGKLCCACKRWRLMIEGEMDEVTLFKCHISSSRTCTQLKMM